MFRSSALATAHALTSNDRVSVVRTYGELEMYGAFIEQQRRVVTDLLDRASGTAQLVRLHGSLP